MNRSVACGSFGLSLAVQHAGRLYSRVLRLLLLVVPMFAGVVHPIAFVLATLALLVALHFFDQPTPFEIA